MPFTSRCPACGATADYPDPALGMRVSCPKCGVSRIADRDRSGSAGRREQTTKQDEGAPPVAPLVVSTEVTATCPACGFSMRLDASWRGRELTCPQCRAEFVAGTDKLVAKIDTPVRRKEAPPPPSGPVVDCFDCGQTLPRRDAVKVSVPVGHSFGAWSGGQTASTHFAYEHDCWKCATQRAELIEEIAALKARGTGGVFLWLLLCVVACFWFVPCVFGFFLFLPGVFAAGVVLNRADAMQRRLLGPLH
jgi:hypothetical protein